ncbi:hypothetical protein ASG43_11835 [Aureimonas sp. Leaf454]|nr:hypothetical protein ASG43_11835 [Aureimonas sp. Leaf454]
MAPFLARLDALPTGHSEGVFEGRRYGVTVRISEDGRRRWLFGEALGGLDRISCNLYRLADGRWLLKPCEMPRDKVIDFVLAYRPDPGKS